MKPAASILGTPRRMFVAVLVVITLVLAWNLSKEWSSDIRSHRVAIGTFLAWVGFDGNHISLGKEEVWWSPLNEGSGILYLISLAGPGWEFGPCERTQLSDVSADDARGEFFSKGPGGLEKFGANWGTNWLIIHDGQIVLTRSSTDTQTVYAIQAVRHHGWEGYFRSRKILPAPR